MAHEIGVGRDELLERRIYVVKMDIGDKAIDADVDAGRFLAVQVAACRQQVRQHLHILNAAPVGGIGSVAPDALKIVALGVVRPRLVQTFRREARMRAHQRVLE